MLELEVQGMEHRYLLRDLDDYVVGGVYYTESVDCLKSALNVENLNKVKLGSSVCRKVAYITHCKYPVTTGLVQMGYHDAMSRIEAHLRARAYSHYYIAIKNTREDLANSIGLKEVLQLGNGFILMKKQIA